MLFNSPEFIFVFLPLAVGLHFQAARWSASAACAVTTLTSLLFYLWWRPPMVLLPVLSIALNFLLAKAIFAASEAKGRGLLALGICANLAVLIYFKYASFLLSTVAGGPAAPSAVPLALSFTTFVQIAFLVDVWRRRISPPAARYAMFVSFFPHLIAGPIVRWSELGPQIENAARYRLDWGNVATGLTLFTFGLAKKVLVADQIEIFVAPVFDAAAQGQAVTMAAAWGGALAYSAQLYFDFSGYSEMAIGLGLLFNLRLPINFAAPFRATSVIDFWRRWHVSLSRFLRDFVYVPLGGSKRGAIQTSVNLLVTMALGGLWHGAGWTFIAWGLFNGAMLAINHSWRMWRGPAAQSGGRAFIGWFTTFIAFAIGMVFFRAADMPSALGLLGAMAGLVEAPPANGIILPWDRWGIVHGYLPGDVVLAVFGNTWTVIGTVSTLAALSIALLLPEPIEIMDYREGEPHSAWRRAPSLRLWRPRVAWLAIIFALFGAAFYRINHVSEFLYYQF